MTQPRSAWTLARPSRRNDVIAWSVGLIAGLGVAGRTFGGDLLLNWDQVVGPTVPMPPGLWGAGPELPRRLPFYVPVAIATRFVPGPTVVGLILVAAVAAATVGTYRLIGRDPVGLLFGVLYGLSPFVLSRAAVGHLPLVAATALLPWAVPSFLDGRRRDVLRWGLVFSLTGSSGAVLGLLPAAIALIRGHRHPAARAGDLVLLAATQACWVVPGIIVVASADGTFPTGDIAAFDTAVSGMGGISRLVIGGGLFISGEDVAARQPVVAALLGLVLLALGVIGRRRAGTWDNAIVAGVVAAAIIVVPLVPIVAAGWHTLVGLGPLSIVRETQKFWPVAFLPLAAGSADQLRTLRRALPLTCLVLLGFGFATAWPGLLGAGGRLVATDASPEFDHLRLLLSETEGTVLVLPWRRYEPLSLSDGRTVLQPAPWLFDTPAELVIADGDGGGSEQPDPRSAAFAEIDRRVRAGEEISFRLRELGVDGVLVEGSADAAFYRRIGSEPSVETLQASDQLLLFDIAPARIAESDRSGPAERRLLRWIGPLTLLVTITCAGWLGRRHENNGLEPLATP